MPALQIHLKSWQKDQGGKKGQYEQVHYALWKVVNYERIQQVDKGSKEHITTKLHAIYVFLIKMQQ